jgi:hypothetical protein
MFSALFATYAVLAGRTADGPTASDVINLRHVFIETVCLLLSSYACGLGALSAERRQPNRYLVFAAHFCDDLLRRPVADLDGGAIPRRGSEIEDYECPRCLAFSVARSHKKALEDGASAIV